MISCLSQKISTAPILCVIPPLILSWLTACCCD